MREGDRSFQLGREISKERNYVSLFRTKLPIFLIETVLLKGAKGFDLGSEVRVACRGCQVASIKPDNKVKRE